MAMGNSSVCGVAQLGRLSALSHGKSLKWVLTSKDEAPPELGPAGERRGEVRPGERHQTSRHGPRAEDELA